jgi:hypothetical protein
MMPLVVSDTETGATWWTLKGEGPYTCSLIEGGILRLLHVIKDKISPILKE